MQRCGDAGRGERQVELRWPWEWDGRGRRWCPKAFHVYNICQVRKREIPLIHTKSINSHQAGILYFPRVVLAGNAWQWRRRRQLGLKLLWFDIWSIRIRTCLILFRAIGKGVKARLFTLPRMPTRVPLNRVIVLVLNERFFQKVSSFTTYVNRLFRYSRSQTYAKRCIGIWLLCIVTFFSTVISDNNIHSITFIVIFDYTMKLKLEISCRVALLGIFLFELK